MNQDTLPGLPRSPAPKKAWPPREIDRTACLGFADAALAKPPARPHIERPEPKGERVARFVVPLELCRPGNPRGYAKPWMHERVKKALWLRMLVQVGGKPWDAPLGGRPHVRCIRFSSVEPDAFADSFKAAVDILCSTSSKGAKRRVAGKREPRRLNIIADDRPALVKQTQHWEPAPRGQGFALIEVWTS